MIGRLTRTVLAAVAAGVLATLVAPSAAVAHTRALGTDPADGATLDQAPAAVSIRFSGTVLAQFTVVVVDGPPGTNHAAGPPTVAGRVVTQPVTGLGSGGYRVAWRVVAEDGHPVSGEFRFTVALPGSAAPSTAGPATAAPSTAAPSTAGPATDGSVASAPTARAPLGEPGPARWWWAAGVGVGLAALGGLALGVVRRRPDPEPTDPRPADRV